MELKNIIELIHTVSKSNLTQFTMEEGNLKISMKTNKQIKPAAVPQTALPRPLTQTGTVQEAAAFAAAEFQEEPSTETGGAKKESTGKVVTSPLVGTFYHAPSPDAEAFVKEGDTVKKGQVLGIIEAMKLMNEIESEYDGIVEKILVSNQEVVEYGQPLFIIG